MGRGQQAPTSRADAAGVYVDTNLNSDLPRRGGSADRVERHTDPARTGSPLAELTVPNVTATQAEKKKS